MKERIIYCRNCESFAYENEAKHHGIDIDSDCPVCGGSWLLPVFADMSATNYYISESGETATEEEMCANFFENIEDIDPDGDYCNNPLDWIASAEWCGDITCVNLANPMTFEVST